MANTERTDAADEIVRLRTEVILLRWERDRYAETLAAIIENGKDEPGAADIATDSLRNMTADEYARQIRLDLYKGEG